MEGRRPGRVGKGFFPHEAIGRFEMEAWEEDGPSGVAGGAWVDVRLRIEREEGDVEDEEDDDAEVEEASGGYAAGAEDSSAGGGGLRDPSRWAA